MFIERDKNDITNTKLKEDDEQDVVYWKFEHTCIYTVRSAYKMLQERKGKWSSQANHGIWKMLWKIRAPPKVLNLVWHALAGCLPTLVELHYKHVSIKVRCPVCGNDNETISHAFIQCQFARQCWQVLNINV